MNIDFEKKDYRFNARVSAIILNSEKNKILLFKVEDGRNYFMLPGGRVEFYEDSLAAINREIFEELGFNLNYKLCAVQENFVVKDNKKITQYCFCYKAIYNGKIILDKIPCKDNENQCFYWIDINKLPDYKIYPISTFNLINSKSIKHIIERG